MRHYETPRERTFAEDLIKDEAFQGSNCPFSHCLGHCWATGKGKGGIAVRSWLIDAREGGRCDLCRSSWGVTTRTTRRVQQVGLKTKLLRNVLA